MAGLIDVAKEVARIDKLLEKAAGEFKRIEGKLSNQGFVAKAPAAVIEKERAKQAEYQRDIEKLTEQKAEISEIRKLINGIKTEIKRLSTYVITSG